MTPGTWILTWSAAATPILAAVLIYCRLGRSRAAPGQRHMALLVGLSSLLLLPVLSEVLPAWFSIDVPFPPEAGAPLQEEQATISQAIGTPEGGRASIPLTAIWLSGFGVLGLRLVIGLVGVRRLRRRVENEATLLEIRHCHAPHSGRTLAVGVYVTTLVRSPSAIGIRAPTVLLPPYVLERRAEGREAIIRHELGHVERGDLALLPIVRAIRALHWPNPLVWLVAARLRETSEEACDRLALQAGISRMSYAQLLVDLARRSRGAKTRGLALSMARNGISRRVTVLLRGPALSSTRLRRACVTSAFLALIFLTAATRFGADDEASDPSALYASAYGVSGDLARRLLDAAAAEDVAPELAFGLVSVESGFDPELESRGGAIGLTQMLPSTAAIFDPRATPTTLRDPDVNARLGLRLLRTLMQSFPGDLERALLAYNIGPAGAARSDAVDVAAYPRAVLDAAARGPTSFDNP